MSRLYAQWQSSGLTKVAFCKENKIVKSTFHYWIKKLHEKEPSSSTRGSGFSQIPVQPLAPVSQDQQALAVINFPSGVRVELFSPVEASFLKQLM